MEKGINLDLTKSLFDFETLLVRVIEALSSEKLSLSQGFFDITPPNYEIGKFVKIDNGDEEKNEGDLFPNDDDLPEVPKESFWIAFAWEENGKRESSLWLSFNAERCTEKYWNKVYKLTGTSGKYYSEAIFKFTHASRSAEVCFFMKDEYLKQFYDENTGLNVQEGILTGFINEVLGKI
jgi:hypothetical protein